MRSRNVTRRRHGSPGLPWLTTAAVVLAVGLWLFAGPAPAGLVFDRAALAQGEGWRWITGHFVHSEARHAWWDIAALALIGALLEAYGRVRMIVATVLGMAAVNLCLVWGLPELDRYCGLSGVLNTLFVVGLSTLWQRYRHPSVAIAAVSLVVKLLTEMTADRSLLIDTAWPSVPLTHLAGALGGLLFVALERAVQR